MKGLKTASVFAVLIFCFTPLSAAELKAEATIHNFYGNFFPGLTFSWEQPLSPYFNLNMDLSSENYTRHFFSSTATFFSPRAGGFGAVLGLGTLYTISTATLFPGLNALVGVRFPNNSLLLASFGAIINPEDIFSALEYIAEVRYEFSKDAQESEVIFRYDRKLPDTGKEQYFALKFHSSVFNEEGNFSLSMRAGAGAELLQSKLNEIMVFGRIGGAWHTKKAGSYGLFFDVFQPVMNGSETKIAIGLEYGIKL